ncbi:pyruvate, phosphate dikinase [Vitiosangium sp. GDMCC 1.1324]|uniref:pyruvate, phosphate dikinase n=1 Tax=Vitiosangium sp. (strain GDMCC 1.1324) TaxID=2138576 RepID=UPI000D3D3955|nr:pyruvate, phosphate dikinase [Vitiosangium sp. GDMCC 1.1324]PTL79888.1 pyruvate, phosphate dikinase [Vitiosangium sp. GDMCC 1.1324]
MPTRPRKTPLRKTRTRSRPSPRLARSPRSSHARPASREKWVYLFDEGRADMKDLLGGKGANLAEMVRIGLPVPPGFVVTTRACNAFLSEGSRFPEGLWAQELAALRKLEKRTGRSFGDPENALLVSCRSGAKFSMPGMMDTLLNLGLNDAVVEGLASETGDARFAQDAYRRLVQMFGTVVLGLPHEPFEQVLERYRHQRGLQNDSALPLEDLKAITEAFQSLIREKAGRDFPQDPVEQLRLATEAVFRSWKGKRAVDYRNAAGIPHDLGTAVNIVTMVFGNRGEDSGTGVVTTRNVSTGEREMEGDYLSNAQGEDVVSGARPTLRISALKELHPKLYAQLGRICQKLERHFRDVQDVEFTIEQGRLWVLQTRDAKRTAQAAVRIAVELVGERLLRREEAVLRVKPEQLDFFLHPQFAPDDKKAARERGDLLATGLNVSPGAASGVVAFDADTAERWSREEKKAVIMVRPETKPDDVHGMLAARGILTSRGGRTSHAALVARQFGKPAVVGVSEMEVDCERRQLTVAGRVLREGDTVSIDGTTGEVFAGRLETLIPDLKDPYILKLLKWADDFRELGVYANADYPRDARKARELGAEGIGLCRTEHMFFEKDRLPHVQRMILARTDAERDEALARLLPFQREDFLGLFRTMEGQPVTIRLLDPPLHEFLPNHDGLLHDVTELETRLELRKGRPGTAELEEQLARKRRMLEAVESMREANPMLGLRGVRLGIHLPSLVRMQVRAILEAACQCAREGMRVLPKIMIPLIAHSNELRVEKETLESEARAVMKEQGQKVAYQFGTMIEVPRAALTADQIAEEAEFFSFGTNDLTQTTYGISRDDAETGFLSEYLHKRILPENPFATLDQRGVGSLMELAVKLGRKTRPGLDLGICGEHGGDPKTISFCHRLGLDYVSCSPYRVPIARLAAAHAALASR